MMPLVLAETGKDLEIVKVGGNAEIKHHLENIGFVVGSKVKIISSIDGNLIVNVKEVRVAVSTEMAKKIMVNVA